MTEHEADSLRVILGDCTPKVKFSPKPHGETGHVTSRKNDPILSDVSYVHVQFYDTYLHHVCMCTWDKHSYELIKLKLNFACVVRMHLDNMMA